ncbi:MAG: RecQ family ATP-dependent DNA helicase [Halieaceae bacterium]|nr:RecQ family ATP-dependent DNA helicase [Halieaceae bacterium]
MIHSVERDNLRRLTSASNSGMKKDRDYKPKCLSLDLEVGIKDQRIHDFAATRGDDGRSITRGDTKVSDGLRMLDDFSEGLTFLLGHNIVEFDLPHLRAAEPNLAILELPVVDTLRLNPLAFPRNPYHRLVKHYQDGQLHRGQLNNPELDSRITLDVFEDQRTAFLELERDDPNLLIAWHWLTTGEDDSSALDRFFTSIRSASRPTDEEGADAVEKFLSRKCCTPALKNAEENARERAWPLAYAMAWLSVAGGNSVMPPWVRHQFPEASEMIRKLRDIPCESADCSWCRERHDAKKELKRWFGFSDFRPEPADDQGRPLQRVIVEAAMRGDHVLGVLPTGTGKSLCYQIPALSRYEKTGALTLVISPLVALMSDQVAGLEARGITASAALNGLLSMPERADVLDRVRMGDIGILIVSPEQLRSPALRKVLAQREIGAWILDEAHCVSKWGHDFRPDYRYVGRFIKEWSTDGRVAPILCLTATAKPDVISDIISHFADKVGVQLRVFDGGANRENLEFDVIPTTPISKYEDINHLLDTYLPSDQPGGAIVYCATRRKTEEIAQFLSAKGLAADSFHAKLPPEAKKSTQQAFINGDLRVIAATNAFGMGIDKPDVRLVIHADIPGSLENYLQEAGRAGRDRGVARCVLLYSIDDVERQFSMSAYSRLSQKDIAAILRSLRRMDKKKNKGGEIVATAGEILAEEEGDFERDSATDDTRVRTALLWLEESHLLTREENRVQVFPSSLRVSSVQEAEDRLEKSDLFLTYKEQLLKLVAALIDSNADEGVTTDELMGVTGLSAEGVRHAMYDLESHGVATNDTALTAYVHQGVANSSKNRFEKAAQIESELIEQMRLEAPDLSKGDNSIMHLRQTTQTLKDLGYPDALPQTVLRMLRSLSMDGRSEAGGLGSIQIKRLDGESVAVTLQREWRDLEKTAQLRRSGAAALLYQLLSTLPDGARGNDLLAETTLGNLRKAIDEDLELRSSGIRDPAKLIDYALLWLHEQEVVRLNKGLAVFRPAMTINLSDEKKGFWKADFRPLKDHYQQQVLQIHVMAEYAQRALEAMADALQLAMDYFALEQAEFLNQWMPNRDKEISMQTTPESWRRIVDELNNPVQQRIVTDEREQTNVLVLAGPGSGKTRVLVHRIAYLVRVKRENPRGILALTYNRHAAVEIRRRLFELVGDDARGVTILTCHALAMRLVGASLIGRTTDSESFGEILRQATALLNGEGLDTEEADERRDQLLAGFRWILVDEYQDLGADQYDLISALAGRSLNDPEGQISLFAVGDDDQNIYAFNGASVEYIRRFEEDYKAKPSYLTENYRSTRRIVEAANAVIESAADRMKSEHPITVDRDRENLALGGAWEALDAVSAGRVQVLPAPRDRLAQAAVVMNELLRMARLDAEWDWSKVAVISREWSYLEPVRSYCELNGLPVQMADEDSPPLWRLRETRQLIDWIESQNSEVLDAPSIQKWIREQTPGPWWKQITEVVEAFESEAGQSKVPIKHFLEWLVEWGREIRRRQSGLMLLTAHRAKGLEFEHVVVLDGSWEKVGKDEDKDAPRRLYYVAMSRAMQTLSLVRFEGVHPIVGDRITNSETFFLRSLPEVSREQLPELDRRYVRLTLKDVDLGFAGRFSEKHGVHRAIKAVTPGARLDLRLDGKRYDLIDNLGQRVGRLAKSFKPPHGMTLESVEAVAIVQRYKQDSAAEYHSKIQSERWEVILPELVFSADRNPRI